MDTQDVILTIFLTTETGLIGLALFKEFAWPKIKLFTNMRRTKAVIESAHNGKTKRVDLDGGGNWVRVDHTKVEVVETIKRIPGLKYNHVRKPEGYSGWEEYVIVTDEVGTAIEMYAQLNEDYAGMSLDEFLLRTLFEHLAVKNDK